MLRLGAVSHGVTIRTPIERADRRAGMITAEHDADGSASACTTMRRRRRAEAKCKCIDSCVWDVLMTYWSSAVSGERGVMLKIGLPKVIEPAAGDRDAFDALELALGRISGSATFCLSAPDMAPIKVPESLYRTLRDAVRILQQGSAVVISPLHRRLSTTEAGKLLGVSRQYLTRLIDKGEIACDRTGRHRRLLLSDVLDYQVRRNEARRTFMDEFTADSAAAGDYD